jgi:transcriptional/translational regulatory protein YebC/TACO1
LINALFEGFGPFGVPMIIEVETDNKNRILGEIKLIFRNYGGNLGESGSVAFMFDKVGEIEVMEKFDEKGELQLIDFGVKDIEDKVITTEVVDFGRIKNKIKEMGVGVESAGLVYRCRNVVALSLEDEVAKILEMIGELDENDDVVSVFAGFDYVQKN